jgi:hypothetical protein
MAKIGIRLADGQFYPILSDDQPAHKRLVVTTVKDDQASVQIDVYRQSDDMADDSVYIGSLIIENIPPAAKGIPDISMDILLDADGNLNTFVREEASGEHQTLRISLKDLGDEEKYEIPDFDFQDSTSDFGHDLDQLGDIQDENPFDVDVTHTFDPTVTDNNAEASLFDEPVEPDNKPVRKRISPILVGILAAIIILLLFGGAFLIYTLTANRMPPPIGTVKSAPFTADASSGTPQTPATTPVTTPALAPAARPATAAAVTTQPAAPSTTVQAVPTSTSTTTTSTSIAPRPAPPTTIASAVPKPVPAARAPDVWYKIRWGDTLWDLSIAYYRTPWLYGKIAQANKIRNPDRIISGTWIYIPPR